MVDFFCSRKKINRVQNIHPCLPFIQNNDNILDILIAGNKFEVEVETTRADASIGQLFLGNSTGAFEAVNYLKSGILLPSNVKDIQKIKLGEKTGILSAINDEKLHLHVLQ